MIARLLVFGGIAGTGAAAFLIGRLLGRLARRPPPAAPGPDVTRGTPGIVCYACTEGRAGECICIRWCGSAGCERGRPPVPVPDMMPAPAPLGHHGVWPMPGAMYDPETEIEQVRLRTGPYPALAPAALAATAEPLPPALAAAGEDGEPFEDDDAFIDSVGRLLPAAALAEDDADADADLCLCVFGNAPELAVRPVSRCPEHAKLPIAAVPSVIFTADPDTDWDDVKARFDAAMRDRRRPSRLIITSAEPASEPITPALLAHDDYALLELAAHADRSEIETAALIGTPAPHDPVWPPWSPWCLEASAERLAVAA